MKLPKKLFTVKSWQKFDDEAQQALLRRYDVILIDHHTKRERMDSFVKKLNAENLNKGIDSFNKGVDSFSKSMDSLSLEMEKMGNAKADPVKAIWGERKTFSI